MGDDTHGGPQHKRRRLKMEYDSPSVTTVTNSSTASGPVDVMNLTDFPVINPFSNENVAVGTGHGMNGIGYYPPYGVIPHGNGYMPYHGGHHPFSNGMHPAHSMPLPMGVPPLPPMNGMEYYSPHPFDHQFRRDSSTPIEHGGTKSTM